MDTESTCGVDPTQIELRSLDLLTLQYLASAQPVTLPGLHIAQGALPPLKPVARAIAQLAHGTHPRWCVPFLIVDTARRTVLGACSFKGAPFDGSVEISYGLARSERGRGAATIAVAKLLTMAADTGEVRDVIAHILPDNEASSRLATRLGFEPGPLIFDPDGERVVRWVWRVPA